MKIDIEEYLLNSIGDISWYGETNHDDMSAENMEKARVILILLGDIKRKIIQELEEHRNYRKGNASAEYLHRKAQSICKMYDEDYSSDFWDKSE